MHCNGASAVRNRRRNPNPQIFLPAPILVAMAGGYSRSIADPVGIHFCTVEFAAHFQCDARQPFIFFPDTNASGRSNGAQVVAFSRVSSHPRVAPKCDRPF